MKYSRLLLPGSLRLYSYPFLYLMNAKVPASKLTKRQRLKFGPVVYTEGDETLKIVATVRYDDECGNGHNSFSITADIREKRGSQWREYMGGCCHEEIAKHFPELKPMIKWHFMNSDGPGHYLANTLYLAGLADCHGHLKGEPINFKTYLQFGDFPILYRGDEEFITWLATDTTKALDIIAVPYEEQEKDGYQFSDKYTFKNFTDAWYKCPFDSIEEAQEFKGAFTKYKPSFPSTSSDVGKGKERELDAARLSAVWPDATDKDLTDTGLEERLAKRLPGLIRDFQKDLKTLGLTY